MLLYTTLQLQPTRMKHSSSTVVIPFKSELLVQGLADGFTSIYLGVSEIGMYSRCLHTTFFIFIFIFDPLFAVVCCLVLLQLNNEHGAQ